MKLSIILALFAGSLMAQISAPPEKYSEPYWCFKAGYGHCQCRDRWTSSIPVFFDCTEGPKSSDPTTISGDKLFKVVLPAIPAGKIFEVWAKNRLEALYAAVFNMRPTVWEAEEWAPGPVGVCPSGTGKCLLSSEDYTRGDDGCSIRIGGDEPLPKKYANGVCPVCGEKSDMDGDSSYRIALIDQHGGLLRVNQILARCKKCNSAFWVDVPEGH